MACKKTPERVPKRTTPGIIGPLLNTSEERTLEIDFIYVANYIESIFFSLALNTELKLTVLYLKKMN